MALIVSLFGILVSPSAGIAQENDRLTVRPRTMATGTRNAAAGVYSLDSVPNYLVYVPPQAVGTRRVPLVVVVPGGGQNARLLLRLHRALADKYGMILLAAEAIRRTDDSATTKLDAALAQALRRFAIDPDKIALTGGSDGGLYTLLVGPQNLDVFSRIAWTVDGSDRLGAGLYPSDGTTQFFFANGGLYETLPSLAITRLLRQAGHTVLPVLVLKGHQERLVDDDYLWSWFQESWGRPRPAGQYVPRVVNYPTPLLTADAVAKVATFEARFRQMADLVLASERMARNQIQVIVPVGADQHLLMRMLDMKGLAAKYPPVAAALAAAGLTADEQGAYRLAIISALATEIAVAKGWAEPAATASTLGKNAAFSAAHHDDLLDLCYCQ